MKFESAPLSFGAVTAEQSTLVIATILLVMLLAVAFAGRRETALVAVFAGVIGVLLAS